MRNLSVYFIIVTGLLLFSCGEQPLYEKSVSFENREWKLDQKAVFEVDIKDANKAYDFTLSIRTSTDFLYSNLYVFMKTESPNGAIAREPLEILITNPDGSWIGNKTGSIVETPLYFKSMTLPEKGKYKFTLEQGITESEVTEILDISLHVDEVNMN